MSLPTTIEEARQATTRDMTELFRKAQSGAEFTEEEKVAYKLYTQALDEALAKSKARPSRRRG